MKEPQTTDKNAPPTRLEQFHYMLNFFEQNLRSAKNYIATLEHDVASLRERAIELLGETHDKKN